MHRKAQELSQEMSGIVLDGRGAMAFAILVWLIQQVVFVYISSNMDLLARTRDGMDKQKCEQLLDSRVIIWSRKLSERALISI